MKQHYFDVPFAFAGDVTAIPDPLQVGGTVSMTEGWNNNYQRNLSTDPAALPIDRSTTNWLLLQISTAIQALQQASVPEFILSSQNGGAAYSYGKGASVLWSASGNAPFVKYVSLTASNTNTPSAADPQGLTTGWQAVVDPISTAAQASAGTDDASIMTPLKVAQQTALRALIAGSATQVFNVGPATALTHAAEAGQVQLNAFNYAGAAGGTANALTATLAPAPGSYSDNLEVIIRVVSNNTGATTLAVNGGAATAVVGAAHAALGGGELVAGGFACFAYSTNLSKWVLLWATGGAEQVGAATQPNHAAQLQQIGHGQCILQFISTTQIKLSPRNGQNVIVNGIPFAIPSAGITLSNSGLAASTFYYIYLTVSAGVGTLNPSTTGHVTGTNGVEVMNGSPGATLVGAVLTNASSQFSASNNYYGVLSWFNRQSISLQPVSTAGTSASSSLSEINSLNRITFISWSGEAVQCSITGFGSPSVAQAAAVLAVGFNSTTVGSGAPCQANAPFASAAVGLSSTFTPFVGTENAAQYITPLGSVTTGNCPFNVINSVTLHG